MPYLKCYSSMLKFFCILAVLIHSTSSKLDKKLIRKRRSAVFTVWENAVIPYTFQPNFDARGKELFIEATNYLRANTCINYRPKVNGDKYWLKVTQDDYVCGGSAGGRQRVTDGQAITFGKNCMALQVFKHELGHAMGFPHEQDRIDRDEYIQWDNTLPTCPAGTPPTGADKVKYLDQAAVDIFYDYVSLMHDWKECIRPKLPGNIKIGPGDTGNNDFSVLDLEKLNAMYDCRGCNGYRFRKIAQLSYNQYPVRAGYELNGETLYICRTYHEGHVIIGKSLPDADRCWVPWQGREHLYTEKFEVLTNPYGGNLQWVRRPNDRSIPKNAIRGGRTVDRETVYIGRCLNSAGNSQTLIPGTLLASNGFKLKVPFNGGESTCDDFEILVCQ